MSRVNPNTPVGPCSKGKAKVAFRLPFGFGISDTSDVMTVTVYVYAGTANNVLSQLNATLPLPKNGANTIALPEGI